MIYKEDKNMSIEKVRAYFRQYGIEDRVREVEESNAAVWSNWISKNWKITAIARSAES